MAVDFNKINSYLKRIRKYDEGGTLIKDHPETKDIYKFYSKWLSNPEYAKRIDKYGFYNSEGKDVARFRQRALDNTTVENNFWDNNIYRDEINKVLLPTKWNFIVDNVPAHEIGHVMGMGNPKGSLSKLARLSIPEQQFIISQMKGYDPNYEEQGFPDKNGKIRIPQKGEYGFSSYKPGEHYGLPGVLNRLYDDPTGWDNLSPEYDKEKMFYHHNPSEAKADLMSFRYWLYKNGIYDINSGKPFTKDLLNKAKQKGGLDAPTKRLLDTFEDKNLINLMNTLASNTQTNNIQYTKLGGKLTKNRF